MSAKVLLVCDCCGIEYDVGGFTESIKWVRDDAKDSGWCVAGVSRNDFCSVCVIYGASGINCFDLKKCSLHNGERVAAVASGI